jgi:hypothetical protein
MRGKPIFFPIPGHGGTIWDWYVTPGKRTHVPPPIGIYEGVNNRDVCASVLLEMYKLKMDAVDLFCDSPIDVEVKTLVNLFKRLNSQLAKEDRVPVVIPLHSNAAGNGRDWDDANGLCTWTDHRSVELAEEIHRRLWGTGLWDTDRGVKVTKWYDKVAGKFRGQGKGIGILKGTPFYSVLPELGFHTNEKDVRTMKSDGYLETIGFEIAQACYAWPNWADWGTQ